VISRQAFSMAEVHHEDGKRERERCEETKGVTVLGNTCEAATMEMKVQVV
jgi:hypothetical protein